ncbi:TPA: hypothetical protein N0F65_007225 [Lagenidium giganteum]|uniref:Calmodulin n=1 Tax=Lagenidium giganteum TaxID=4803 RepID=A0AAV2Z7V1_9STRA|nr:TPA: hypothetical protein N0F65_007225 [Lagenidium giganteum]
MASKYAKQLQVPLDFPDVLRNFTREVLRLQGKVETKEAIYEFGVQYFQELIVKRDGSAAKLNTSGSSGSSYVPAYMKMGEDEVQAQLNRAFHEADGENNGLLSYDNFKQIMHRVAEELELSPTEIKALYAEADETEQGAISYAGKSQLNATLVAALYLRSNKAQRHTKQEAYAKRDTEALIHGMMQDEMESLLREVFQRADADEIGTLDRVEFMNCIRDADLGFCRREVNILMSEVPVEHDNRVVYPDFIPMCYPLLKEVFTGGVVELPNDQDSLTQYLVEVFASGDTEGTGLLSVGELTRLFRAADIGLTRLQIITVMAEAQEDKSGFVNYEKFAAHVAGMVLVLVSFESQQNFAPYLQKYRKSSDYYTILDLNQHTFEQTLSRALEAVDENHRGLLPRQDAIEAIRNTFPDISQRQLRSLMALADTDDMGEVEYHVITHSAFQALQKLQEYDVMIMES